MQREHLFDCTPTFTRLQDWTGNLYERASMGELVRDCKTLAAYEAEFTVEPIGVVNGMLVLWFFQLMQ